MSLILRTAVEGSKDIVDAIQIFHAAGLNITFIPSLNEGRHQAYVVTSDELTPELLNEDQLRAGELSGTAFPRAAHNNTNAVFSDLVDSFRKATAAGQYLVVLRKNSEIVVGTVYEYNHDNPLRPRVLGQITKRGETVLQNTFGLVPAK